MSSKRFLSMASEEQLAARFHIDDQPGVRDPHRDLKASWQMMKRAERQIEDGMAEWTAKLDVHVDVLEARLRGAGVEPPKRPSFTKKIDLPA